MDANQECLVQEHFTDHAGEWDAIYRGMDFHSRVIQERLRTTLRYVDSLGFRAGGEALDLGCGAGLTARALLERGFKITAVDVSEAMLDLTRKNCAAVAREGCLTVRQGAAEEIDAEDASFDLVVALGLIEYLRDDRRALREIIRVLKPGGGLVVTAPNRLRLGYLLDPFRAASKSYYRLRIIARSIVMFIGGRYASRFKRSDSAVAREFQRRLYSPSQLKRQLKEAGYAVLAYRSHGFGPLPLFSRSEKLTMRVDDAVQCLSDKWWIPILKKTGNNLVYLCRKPTAPNEA